MTKRKSKTLSRLGATIAARLAAAAVHAAGTVGNALPDGFPVIEDASLLQPVIGFGATGAATRTPVIFLHGNNDVPYPTACSVNNGKVQELAQHLDDAGWQPSVLWGLGYQGDQCVLASV
jgi:hypothetical protein